MKKPRKSPLMKKTFTISILLIFTILTISAQTKNEVFVVDALVCDSTGTGIKDVAIYDAKNNLRSVTDGDGFARIATRLDETFSLSHLSFNTKFIRIEKDILVINEKGRYSMLVVMQDKTNTLQEVTVTENAPHLAYANKKVWVIDYKVQHDGIYMVAGNGYESVLLHLGFEQDTISRKPISRKYQELYRDAFDNLHLIGPDSTYQIYCDGKQLQLLYGCKKELFRQKLESVKILTDSIMVLQNYYNMQQQLAYVMVNRNTKETSIMANLDGAASEMARNAKRDAIRDRKIDMMLDEFQEDAPTEKGIEKSVASSRQRSEMNYQKDNEVEERRQMMSHLYNRILFKPIYCPAILIKDSIYIFDFQNDNLLKFDNLGRQTATCEIGFHKTGYFKNLMINNPWDEKLIIDEVTGQCYAQFSSNGIVTLKEINLADGKPKHEIRLSEHTFPQNIQIYNGEVYYLFLDKTQTAGSDRRSLYKMRLR